MNERIIILMVLAILAAIAVVVYAMTGPSKRAEKSEDERTIELLRIARLMFPSAEGAFTSFQRHVALPRVRRLR